MAWLGGTLATQNWYLIISFISMGYLYLKAARIEEEQWLTSKDASLYAHYYFKIGIFFPKFFNK
jgi:protein-S-isoprenylcysteine O-methyltransferase Ste14